MLVIQGKYSAAHGWEDLDEYDDDDRREAERVLGEYRIASPGHPHRLIERDGDDDAAELDAPASCPQCGGEAMPIGTLGATRRLRCRACGWSWGESLT